MQGGCALAAPPSNSWTNHEVEYNVIILGAPLVGTGAKVREHDLQQLRQLASEVVCSEKFTLALSSL